MTVRAAFRVDANALIGSGHFMRCLTLADELRRLGGDAVFVTSGIPQELASRLEAAGHHWRTIEPAGDHTTGGGRGWEAAPWSQRVQTMDAELTCKAIGDRMDWLVVDHYLLGRCWEQRARHATSRLLVIDDLANRSHDCDLLLDQTLGRTPASYSSLVPHFTRMLLGPQYALLRPEFASERPAALVRRRTSNSVRRILVSLGGTDVGNFTAFATKAALDAVPDGLIDVVMSPSATAARELQSLAAGEPRLSLQIDTKEMGALMRDADLSIGAAGASSWERCCLGLPTVALIVANNQYDVGNALSESGAAVVGLLASQLPQLLDELLADQDRRLRMVAAAAALTDGNGTRRVADAMALPRSRLAGDASVLLRAAIRGDCELLWLWRNDPLMRAMAKTSEPIAWPDHARWFSKAISSQDTELLVAERSGTPAAAIRFDTGDGRALVSINVNPSMRGQGVGKAALIAACNSYQSQWPSRPLSAEVHFSNTASRRIFLLAGFQRQRNEDNGFERFVRPAAVTSCHSSIIGAP